MRSPRPFPSPLGERVAEGRVRVAAKPPAPRIHRKRLPSTQDFARKLAERGAPSGTLVRADAQTRGRGRMDRRWASGPGGLYLTLILRPPLAPDRLASLSLRAAKAVARTLRAQGASARVQAPNDVLIRTPLGWRKAAGLLLEAASRGGRTEWLLIGVGVNANNRLPPGLEHAATLRGVLGRRVGLERLERSLIEGFMKEFPWARR